MTVSSYYGKLNSLWEELSKHVSLISCHCCTQSTAGLQHQERRVHEKLHDFLMGLYSEYYARLHMQILSTEPLPSLDRAYQLVVQDERVRLTKSVLDDQSSSVLGFALRASSSPGRGTGDRPVCTRCHKVGHDVSKCWSFLVCTQCKKNGHEIGYYYELVGYPENFGSGRGSSTSSGRCSSTSRGCGSAKAHTIHTVGTPSSDSNDPTSTLSTDGQWKALAGLLGHTKVPDARLNGEFDSSLWIIDTGASHHVTSEKSWLFDLVDIVDCPVGLPNGDSVLATQKGSVRLSDSITLTYVLFVPTFGFSLLSVSQLTRALNCIVQFNSSMCAIDDETRALIGTGHKRDELYYFNGGVTLHQVTINSATSDFDLWHKRMGHSLKKVVKLLPPSLW
ncbi:uncharacterized protein LOC125496476 [Beta vulgaris subsp. vulgaris]|uniref:uncharacterized protein LOC125496476 n=1 Tax=Beta vulgaris subsp. vulgaris TaxID=3555 RepID=UPI0020374095|nr:uncharacterized protein LOC125496476 [Beta vulgaris subsp. vulgaris]